MHEGHLMTENSAVAAWHGKVTCPCGSVQVHAVHLRTVSSSRPLSHSEAWTKPRCGRRASLDGGSRRRSGRVDSVSDLQTAVGIDPSLARYVTIKGKTVSLSLPPL